MEAKPCEVEDWKVVWLPTNVTDAQPPRELDMIPRVRRVNRRQWENEMRQTHVLLPHKENCPLGTLLKGHPAENRPPTTNGTNTGSRSPTARGF